MKGFILASLLLIVRVSASILEEHGAKFQAFKLMHRKTYKNHVEEAKRFAIFQDKLRLIEEHNALFEQGFVSYKKGINQFSDMTQKEFRALLTLHHKPTINGTEFIPTGVAIPSSLDWRRQGYVTGVKDQGDCGSCWAFSVTGAIEGAFYRKHYSLVSLSEQQLIDCSTNINYGCDGGYMDLTFAYIKKYGIQTENSYPYTALDGNCTYNASKVVTKVNGYNTILQDEYTLLEAVGTLGPISVGLDASYLSDYSSGIYSERYCNNTDLNHGALVVGYGSEENQDFWIVKNSWGSLWGEEGYFRIVRGTNECGIAEEDSYPIIR